MGKVGIDLLFLDSDRLGEIPGVHLIFAQKIDDPLANGPFPILMLTLRHVRDRLGFLSVRTHYGEGTSEPIPAP